MQDLEQHPRCNNCLQSHLLFVPICTHISGRESISLRSQRKTLHNKILKITQTMSAVITLRVLHTMCQIITSNKNSSDKFPQLSSFHATDFITSRWWVKIISRSTQHFEQTTYNKKNLHSKFLLHFQKQWEDSVMMMLRIFLLRKIEYRGAAAMGHHSPVRREQSVSKEMIAH
jgi:hypothetical protein